MSISNYGELKNEISALLFHPRFAARYDNFTIQFETAANSRLRVLPMEENVSLTTANGAVTLPTDYLAWRSVKRTGRPGEPEVDYVHSAYLPAATSNRQPPVFNISGSTFFGRPVDNTADAWNFFYYKKIPTLVTTPASNGNTNWLLTEFPNAYIFGLMTEAAAAQRNLEMAQLYKARRDEQFMEIIQRYAMTTGATSPSVRTAEYF